MKGRWPITLMCEVLQVSASGYFHWDASTRVAKKGRRQAFYENSLMAGSLYGARV